MILKVYSIKDEQNGYRLPIVSGSDGDMKRSFILEAKNTESLIHQVPQDFSVWAVGEWDTDNGIMTMYNEKKLIERAVNVFENL